MLAKKPKTRKPMLPDIGGDNLLPTSMLVMAVSTMLLGIGFVWLAGSLSKLSSQQPTFIQTTDGRAFVAVPTQYDYRNPQLLQNTARDWAILTFSWGEVASDVVQGSVDLTEHKSGKIPLSAYKASMLLSDDFRDSFLTTFTSEVFTTEAAQGKISSLYVPLQVIPPKKIGEGRWEVEIFGSRYVSTPRNPAGKIVPANFRVELIAADIPQSPLAEDTSPTVQAVYKMFESGLRITKVEELPSVR